MKWQETLLFSRRAERREKRRVNHLVSQNKDDLEDVQAFFAPSWKKFYPDFLAPDFTANYLAFSIFLT